MNEHAVVIVEGGPTGLMLAGELALAGIDTAIVARRGDRELIGLRSGGLHTRTSRSSISAASPTALASLQVMLEALLQGAGMQLTLLSANGEARRAPLYNDPSFQEVFRLATTSARQQLDEAKSAPRL